MNQKLDLTKTPSEISRDIDLLLKQPKPKVKVKRCLVCKDVNHNSGYTCSSECAKLWNDLDPVTQYQLINPRSCYIKFNK